MNSSFKKGYLCFEEWKEAIFKVLAKFENKSNEMKRYNYSSKSLIYYINNININSKNIHILNQEDIRNLNILSNENDNNNILSYNSISSVHNIYLENLENNDECNVNETDEFIDADNDKESDKLIENFENLNLEEYNDLKYFIILNIKYIDLIKINDEIKTEINK